MTQPDFIIIPTIVLADKRLNALDGKVFGYIYWLTKLKDEKCTASNRTLAELANTSPNTIQHCLTRLESCGYITRVYHAAEVGIEILHNEDRKIRLEILCNVKYETRVLPTDNTVLPTGNGGVLLTDNQNKNTNKKSNKDIHILAGKILVYYNQEFGRAIKSTTAFEKNLQFWLQCYSTADIHTAFLAAKDDPYWCDKITPEILFRQKNPNGESVDRIGDLMGRHKGTPELVTHITIGGHSDD